MSSQPFPNDPVERSEAEHDTSGSAVTTVRQEGSAAVGETQRQAQDVLRHAGDRTADVIDEARHEVRDVVDEARAAISREADDRTRQTGGALRAFSDDLHQMSEQGAERTTAAQYVDAVATSVERLASRLEQDGSEGLVDSVRERAEQSPKAFASGAAFAGFVVGRLVRNGQRPGDAAASTSSGSDSLFSRSDDESRSDEFGSDEFGSDETSRPAGISPQQPQAPGRPGSTAVPQAAGNGALR